MRNASARVSRFLRSSFRCSALVAGVVGSLSIGSALARQSAEAARASPPEAAGQDRHAKVCEYELVTGSRMRKRVCMTQEQRDARMNAGREVTRELERKEIAADGGS